MASCELGKRIGDITVGKGHKGVCQFQIPRTIGLRLRKKQESSLKLEFELGLQQVQDLESQAERKGCPGGRRNNVEVLSMCRHLRVKRGGWSSH